VRGSAREDQPRRMLRVAHVYVGFTNGGNVRLRIKESAEDKLLAAAFRQRCGWDVRDGRILVGMEYPAAALPQACCELYGERKILTAGL
jgi:hypothetical protein